MKEEGGTLLGDKGVRRHQVSASTLNNKENTNETTTKKILNTCIYRTSMSAENANKNIYKNKTPKTVCGLTLKYSAQSRFNLLFDFVFNFSNKYRKILELLK